MDSLIEDQKLSSVIQDITIITTGIFNVCFAIPVVKRVPTFWECD